VDGQDLDVLVVVTAVDVLVLDAEIGELDVPVEVGQAVVVRPVANLVLAAIGPALGVRPTPVALVQPLLVLTLELVVQDDPIDACTALLEPLRLAQIGAIDLCVVPISRGFLSSA